MGKFTDSNISVIVLKKGLNDKKSEEVIKQAIEKSKKRNK